MEIFGKEISLFSKSKKKGSETRSADIPEKVFIEKNDGYDYEVSTMEPAEVKMRLNELLYGEYAARNFVTMFYTVPEVFAPVHEIASRVADATWQLKRTWNDEVDYKNEDFNRLFTQPNVLTEMRSFVYQAVCYEILTGRQLFAFNNSTIFDEAAKNVIAWFNLPAHKTTAELKDNVDPYTATDLSDFIKTWKTPVNGKDRRFKPEDVLAIMNLNLNCNTNVNKPASYLLGASKAIKNLIPVYEARGVIYIKRGAMGFLVSAKKDADGTKALTKGEKKDLREEADKTYGLQKHKSTVGITDQPVDFIKTSMSISEMEPFSETLADACAIYACLRVPPHLIPSKDRSTFNNADADMKAFYNDVVIPWAKRYAQAWTGYLKFDRRYIFPDYSHIGYLKDNEKDKAAADKQNGDTWLQRWENGLCSLNEWIASFDGTKGTGSFYEKKIFELTPEEIDQVSKVMAIKQKSKPQPNEQQQQDQPGDSGKKDKGAPAKK